MGITIENGGFMAVINEKGAELRELRSKSDGHNWLWKGDPEVWGGVAPVLFPVVGRVKNRVYRYEGKEYPMNIHGFAARSMFRAENISASSAEFVLEDSEETLKCYPFPFRLTVRFSLEDNKLKAEHTVYNTGSGELWFSIGAHPAFACDVGDILRFEKPETAAAWRLDGSLLGGKEPFLDGQDTWEIKSDSFVRDAYMLSELSSSYVALERKNTLRLLRFHFDAPYLGIWAKPGAPYVCLEPWHGIDENAGHSGEFTEKQGIRRLGSGDSYTLLYNVDMLYL